MVKVGLCVERFKVNEIEFNIEVIKNCAINAESIAVDLVCFGEATLQGFDSLSGNFDLDKNIAITKDSPYIAQLKEIALNHQIGLGVGYFEKEDEKIYCSYMIIDKDGKVLVNYRRISSGWKELNWNNHYQEGKHFAIFDFLGVRFTLGLCGDFWIDDNLLPPRSDNVIWPVFISQGYEDWQTGNAIEDYGKQSNKIGKNVVIINAIIEQEQFRANGRALYFVNGELKGQIPLLQRQILSIDLD